MQAPVGLHRQPDGDPDDRVRPGRRAQWTGATSEPAMKSNTAPRREETHTQRGAVTPQGPSLPHERDQQNRSVDADPNPHIERAASDLKQGKVDTDLRATPGLDANRRGTMVPGGERGAGDRKPRPGR
jgi:hypothetical protein